MTNVFRGLMCVLLCVAALPAMGAAYADQTALDLFRRYDRTTGKQAVTVTSAQNSNSQKVTDGSNGNAQVNGGTTRWDMLFTLDEVCYASQLVMNYTSYHPDSFSIYYSTTGDDWTAIVENEASQMTSHQDRWVYDLPGGAAGTAIKFLKIVQEPSSVDNYIRMDRVQLFAAANNTFDDQKDGFNYFANPSSRYTYVSTDNGVKYQLLGDPNQAFDGDLGSHFKPVTGALNWLVIPLGEVKSLWGINLGFYDGQAWDEYAIYVSCADDMPVANPAADGFNLAADWTPAYDNVGRKGTEFIGLRDKNGDLGMDAKWVYIQFKGVDGTGAMVEIETYVSAVVPIPEPATMSLLALGGLALLRRR